MDVAHVHNIYGRLITSTLDVLTQKWTPIVMTLHDYKVIWLVKKTAPDTRISFSGYLTGEPLAEITWKSLAVVVPSEWFENAPLSVIEAMACGKPVIGARIGRIPEMIDDGKNGFLFQSGSVDALSQAMARLLEIKADAISEMGRFARLKAEKEYHSDSHYDRLIALYRKAIDHRVSHGAINGHRWRGLCYLWTIIT